MIRMGPRLYRSVLSLLLLSLGYGCAQPLTPSGATQATSEAQSSSHDVGDSGDDSGQAATNVGNGASYNTASGTPNAPKGDTDQIAPNINPPKGDREYIAPMTALKSWRFTYGRLTTPTTAPIPLKISSEGMIGLNLLVEFSESTNIQLRDPNYVPTWKKEEDGKYIRFVLTQTRSALPQYCDIALKAASDGTNATLEDLSILPGELSVYFVGNSIDDSVGKISDCSQGLVAFPDSAFANFAELYATRYDIGSFRLLPSTTTRYRQ